ncbi:TIGR01212 family radical SAM protein [candidate division WOR-3 bacterium]|jgi:radical SAM protein (TIGR01212 family)|nr:TIGR01212 family radical SAM protein [candidate division WOR-3 bacterium]
MLSQRTVGEYWKEKFGEKVYRVSIDAGFTCPTRDGTKGRNGCIFCDERGSRPHSVEPSLSVSEQLETGIKRLKKRGINRFIAYFQAYTNTYAPASTLKKKYYEALKTPEIVGISISTRPDCIDGENLDLIEEIGKDYYTIIELGIQSVHEDSLVRIGRMHTVEDSREAIKMIHERRNIEIVAHLIIGLPGENEDDIIETADTIKDWEIDGVKLHHLYVIKGTVLEKEYKEGKVKVFEDPAGYATIAKKVLEHLSPSTIIHRFQGYAPKEELVAPSWTSNRFIIRQLILGR